MLKKVVEMKEFLVGDAASELDNAIKNNRANIIKLLQGRPVGKAYDLVINNGSSSTK